jgi:hypothetical protein
MMPVLAPADLFLWQGMQAFEDLCNSCLRASHLLEFYRNVCEHAEERAFWSQVRESAEEQPAASFALGVVLQLVELVMEEEVPSGLAMWSMLRLPAAVQRSLDLHGLNCVYGTSRGTKLSLLLRRELEKATISSTPSDRTGEMPVWFPQVIDPVGANDTLTFGTRRALQFRLIVQRLRFYVAEGLRHAWVS